MRKSVVLCAALASLMALSLPVAADAPTVNDEGEAPFSFWIEDNPCTEEYDPIEFYETGIVSEHQTHPNNFVSTVQITSVRVGGDTLEAFGRDTGVVSHVGGVEVVSHMEILTTTDGDQILFMFHALLDEFGEPIVDWKGVTRCLGG